jgi:hypothetical protein
MHWTAANTNYEAPANSNDPPYWSQPVLDRARELTARLEARKRAAAKAEKAAAEARRAQARAKPAAARLGLRSRGTRWLDRWDDLGLFNQYGLTVAATVLILYGTTRLLA